MTARPMVARAQVPVAGRVAWLGIYALLCSGASAAAGPATATASAAATATTTTSTTTTGTTAAAGARVLTIGGAVTEIAWALGAGDRVVGVDSSSTYPEAATRLPQVGYARQLSAEGVLSLRPTLVLALADAGPATALEQLRAAGVTLVRVPEEHSVAGARARIAAVAAALDAGARGRELTRALDDEVERAHAVVARLQTHPRVLFIYARGGGTLLAAGRDSAADEMIRLAGAVNAVSAYSGYRPLTAEAVVAAAPDRVLITSRGLTGLGGAETLWRLPGLGLTPAGQRRALTAMDDLTLLSFGPRTGRAIAELAVRLRDQPWPR